MSCDHCPCPGACRGAPVDCEWAASDDPVRRRHVADRCGGATAYPGAATMAAALARALWDWAVSGFARASEAEAARRLATCEACDRFDPGPRRCRHLGCGCYLEAKARMRTEHCPIGKW